jgi:hypothetical protein
MTGKKTTAAGAGLIRIRGARQHNLKNLDLVISPVRMSRSRFFRLCWRAPRMRMKPDDMARAGAWAAKRAILGTPQPAQT